jgi:hypothetical protein
MRLSGIPPTQLVDRSYLAYRKRPSMRLSGIPPTQLVDRSYLAYRKRRRMRLRNPTNAVGGSFILSLVSPTSPF